MGAKHSQSKLLCKSIIANQYGSGRPGIRVLGPTERPFALPTTAYPRNAPFSGQGKLSEPYTATLTVTKCPSATTRKPVWLDTFVAG